MFCGPRPACPLLPRRSAVLQHAAVWESERPPCLSTFRRAGTRPSRPRMAPLRALLLLACSRAWAAAGRVPRSLSPPPPPSLSQKVAFCFLTRGELPLAAALDAHFFSKAAPAAYSIYVHARPGFELNSSTVASPLFYGRTVRRPTPVRWGSPSVSAAERILFAAALEDRANAWRVPAPAPSLCADASLCLCVRVHPSLAPLQVRVAVGERRPAALVRVHPRIPALVHRLLHGGTGHDGPLFGPLQRNHPVGCVAQGLPVGGAHARCVFHDKGQPDTGQPLLFVAKMRTFSLTGQTFLAGDAQLIATDAVVWPTLTSKLDTIWDDGITDERACCFYYSFCPPSFVP